VFQTSPASHDSTNALIFKREPSTYRISTLRSRLWYPVLTRVETPIFRRLVKSRSRMYETARRSFFCLSSKEIGTRGQDICLAQMKGLTDDEIS
jgi:hypothetical protein